MNLRPSIMNRTPLVALLLGLSLASSSWAAELGDDEWYLRLIVSHAEENLLDDNNLLGQLADSVAGYDRHDLIELPPFDTPYLTLVFPHPDWADKAGDYATDFHQRKGRQQVWYFEVLSDDGLRDITLRWALTSKTRKPRDMWLVDALTGEIIHGNSRNTKRPAVSEYAFTMEGRTSRPFYWVQGGRGLAEEQTLEPLQETR